MAEMEWRQVSEHEWWHVFKDAPEDLRNPDANGMRWPPDYTISWAGSDWSCVHLYHYYNGQMPDDPNGDEENVDYDHICNLPDFIAMLEDFITSAKYVAA